MAGAPPAVVEHYQRMQSLQVLGIAAARRSWKRVSPEHIRESWAEAVDEYVDVLEGLQYRAAAAGSSYGAQTLAQSSGVYRPPAGFVDPAGFVGVAPSGAPLRAAAQAPVVGSLLLIKQGADPASALRSGLAQLQRLTRTAVADAGRTAAQADLASRRGVGYIRMVNPPACDRCILLAGRFFRWNNGFRRHPNCDCVHVPSTKQALDAAGVEGLVLDPDAYFDSLSEAEQDRVFGRANAEAIRSGADMGRVVNARRGMSVNGQTTTALTGGRRGRAEYFAERGGRLTPEGIFAQAGSREEAVALLKEHGYMRYRQDGSGSPLLVSVDPKGRDYEGFGQMGRGGTRRGYRDATLEAWRTGVSNDATMTAAERRVHTARLRYEAVLDGRNPYSSKRPLTPALSARVEEDYRYWLNRGGQIHTS